MPTARPEHGHALRAVLAAGLLLVSGCGVHTPPSPSDQPSRNDFVEAVDRLLDRRSAAVEERDRESFLATVATSDSAVVQAQGEWFDDVSSLPVAVFSQTARRRSVRVHADRATAVVSTTLQLETYDATPVVREMRLHFVRDGDRWRISAVRDPAWERDHDADLQPWDLGPVEIVEGDGVLGVFDAGSVGRASELIGVVEQAVEDVSAVVPFEWSRHVVVYALTDTAVLDEIDGLPGNDPESLDAVAFPVSGEPGESGPAGIRVLLNPRMLEIGPEEMARLVRHEITHVAVGPRDDGGPLWLSEGIAEWVSVQPLPESSRLVSGSALAAARDEPRTLPADEGFNSGDVGAHYGLSWWACQTIVDMYGESMLWRLMDALAGTAPAGRDEVLEETVGMDEQRLAEEAATRIVATYG